MLNLEYLLAFVTAAEKGSFSAAGKHIGKSQSTISVGVNNLELDLGVTLFDRSGKYPKLTAEGEHLYQQAKVLMRQADRIKSYTSAINQEVEHSLSIGLDPMVPMAALETALEKVAGQFPFTQINIVKKSSEELFEELNAGQLDFVLNLASEAVPEYFEFAAVFQLESVCVCSPDSEFADMEIVKNEMLTTVRQIICTSLFEHTVWGPISTMSQSFWLVQEQDDMIRLVEQGIGWAYLPRVMLEERVEMGTLIEFKPEYLKVEPSFTVDLLWSPNSKQGPAFQYLRQMLFS